VRGDAERADCFGSRSRVILGCIACRSRDQPFARDQCDHLSGAGRESRLALSGVDGGKGAGGARADVDQPPSAAKLRHDGVDDSRELVGDRGHSRRDPRVLPVHQLDELDGRERLVGPSGCGKSTLLRMIAGLEEVSGGRISIGSEEVTDLAPRSRDIAMVFQSYALYPHMTVRQNIGYGLKVRRAPKDEARRRVAEVAELLGLEDLLDRRPAHLSGGQRQRVAMGRAIVREPKAFLMDEPLSNLDAKLRVGMRASLA